MPSPVASVQFQSLSPQLSNHCPDFYSNNFLRFLKKKKKNHPNVQPWTISFSLCLAYLKVLDTSFKSLLTYRFSPPSLSLSYSLLGNPGYLTCGGLQGLGFAGGKSMCNSTYSSGFYILQLDPGLRARADSGLIPLTKTNHFFKSQDELFVSPISPAAPSE